VTRWNYYRGQGNKYNNKKAEADGLVFDSVRERNRYLELKLMERAGDISDLRRQVKFTLIDTQREPDTQGPRGGIKRGKVIEKETAYIADFVYTANGETVVEDAKGVKTPEYIIKRKLMLERYGIRIKEI
jgi:hypothetical protein